jgi:hypothetical protein
MPHNTSNESAGVTFHLQTSANHSPGKSNNVLGQPSQRIFSLLKVEADTEEKVEALSPSPMDE